MRHIAAGCLALGSGVAMVLTAGPAGAVDAYNVTTLPLVTAALYRPHILNRWGQAVLDSALNPALWSPLVANGTAGTLTVLSDLPGYPTHPAGQTTELGVATSLNDRGQIVGSAATTSPAADANGAVSWLYTPSPLNTPAGVLNTAGAFTVFPLLAINGLFLSERPSDINNTGRIIGSGAYYYPWAFTPVTANGGTGTWRNTRYAQVNDAVMNDRGTYVVFARSPHTGALRTTGIPTGTNGGFITSAQWADNNQAYPVDVSDAGLVLVQAPVAGAPGVTHTYVVKGTVVRDITPGALTSFGAAINNSAMVVGRDIQAWIYTNGTQRKLATLVTEDTGGFNPVAINDAGQILARNEGYGETKLLTPAALVTADRATASAAAPVAVTGGFTVQITVTNHKATPLAGPVSVALDGVSAQRIPNRAGVTSYAGPAGSGLITVAAGDIAGNASATVTVRITGAATPTVTPRVLAGPAPR